MQNANRDVGTPMSLFKNAGRNRPGSGNIPITREQEFFGIIPMTQSS